MFYVVALFRGETILHLEKLHRSTSTIYLVIAVFESFQVIEEIQFENGNSCRDDFGFDVASLATRISLLVYNG